MTNYIRMSEFSADDLKSLLADCNTFITSGKLETGSRLRLLSFTLAGSCDLLSIQHTIYIVYQELERRYWDLFSTVEQLVKAAEKEKILESETNDLQET